MEAWRKELYLAHHGIKGQKWGVRRGPPYPLGAHPKGTKSLRKSFGRLDNRVEKSYNASKKLSKLVDFDQFNRTWTLGERIVKETLKRFGSRPVGSLGDFESPSDQRVPNQSGAKPKRKPIIRDPKTGFKLIHESLNDSLINANPLKDSSEGDNNCSYCAVAGFLRTQGYDATAKSTGGKMQNMAGVLEDAFKGVKVYEGSATKFAKSPEDAAQMLRKRFGDNASGAVGIDFVKGQGGHVFNWTINDGSVRFLDFQPGADDTTVRKYWRHIDPNGNLTFARLDKDRNGNELEINLDNIDKYVNGR